jgi:cold shock CspA family protein
MRTEKGTVRYFDYQKGHGFAKCDEGGEVFLSRNVGEQIANLEHGDRIQFVRVSDKGIRPLATNVTLLEKLRVSVSQGTVIRYDQSKGFGFIALADLDEDAFFNQVVMRDSSIDYLEPGDRVRATIARDPKTSRCRAVKLELLNA